jgi:hypothetical protein
VRRDGADIGFSGFRWDFGHDAIVLVNGWLLGIAGRPFAPDRCVVARGASRLDPAMKDVDGEPLHGLTWSPRPRSKSVMVRPPLLEASRLTEANHNHVSRLPPLRVPSPAPGITTG